VVVVVWVAVAVGVLDGGAVVEVVEVAAAGTLETALDGGDVDEVVVLGDESEETADAEATVVKATPAITMTATNARRTATAPR
jgi:hypothetical protein